MNELWPGPRSLAALCPMLCGCISWGLGSLHTSQRRTGGVAAASTAVQAGWPGAWWREASPSLGLGGEIISAQEPSRGPAIRVEGSFSRGRGRHLGARRPIRPRGSRGRWAATRGTAEAALRPGDPTRPGHPDGGVAPTPRAVLQDRGGKPHSACHLSFSRLEFSLQVAGTGEHLPPRVVGYFPVAWEARDWSNQPGELQVLRPQARAVGVQKSMCAVLHSRSTPEASELISHSNCSPARCPRPYPQHSLEHLLCRRLLTQFRKNSSPSHKGWGELRVLPCTLLTGGLGREVPPGREQWQNRGSGLPSGSCGPQVPAVANRTSSWNGLPELLAETCTLTSEWPLVPVEGGSWTLDRKHRQKGELVTVLDTPDPGQEAAAETFIIYVGRHLHLWGCGQEK